MSEEEVKLSEKAEKQAHDIYTKFCTKMRDLCDETLGDFEVNCLAYLETDAWMNYRSELRLAMEKTYMRNAGEIVSTEEAWAKFVREAIYKQFDDELRDQRVTDLEKQVEYYKQLWQESMNRY